MKKILSFTIFLLIIYIILSNSSYIIENIRFSFNICINNLFPALIPFMILSNILIKYNFINDISEILSIIMTKVFKVSKYCGYALIMSMISGTPSNSKYLKDLLDNNTININDVKKCLNFIHFNNPIFILGTIGYTFLNNKRFGLIILISHYLSALIIGLFNKNNNYYNEINTNNKKQNFIKILKNSITDTIDTLLLILGIVTTCIIFTTLIDSIIHINNNYKFIYGILEITQGLKYLSMSNISINLKVIISSMIISFGGVCIHAQVFLILDNKKIRYIPYLLSRLIHAILSAILSYILINLFH